MKTFENFPERVFRLISHVVGPDFSDIDLVIGRDFLEEHELTLVYRPCKTNSNTFTQLLLQTDVCYTGISRESILDERNRFWNDREKKTKRYCVRLYKYECKNCRRRLLRKSKCSKFKRSSPLNKNNKSLTQNTTERE